MNKIILYSSSECYRCKLVKRMLDIHNVKYEEICDNRQLMLEKGFDNIPVLEVNGETFDEYTSVLNWLRDNNYYNLWEEDDG